VHFDTALNLIWLAMGIFAFAGAVRATRRHAGTRIVGAALIVAALLFPYISATDDVLRIEHSRSQNTHSSSSQRGASDDLIRLYQTMDTPLVCAALRVFLTLFFVLLVWTTALRRIDRDTPFESGRSPPALAFGSI
jgi:hypothetical protein